MKTLQYALGSALLAASAFVAIAAQADEAGIGSAKGGSRAGGDRDAVAPLVQHAPEKLAPDHVAEGGADRLRERQLAADGSDRLKQNQLAGHNPLRGTRVAEGGSDRLIENRLADGGYGYDSSSEVMPYFCIACR
ncbi:hypothetical protein PS645_00458 [Pseudomonas fluorescens]|uniref:Phage infection protein n=1 Tax=Pseudomonas fluorescens TaxID=294 RepID=A0A5E6PNG4_PSEFL|nr:hypothetical protein [Pseudomonas fluorescens]VVM45146.1 hypothetical protein PS645_00458 [Pseudomonas fluorescens]